MSQKFLFFIQMQILQMVYPHPPPQLISWLKPSVTIDCHTLMVLSFDANRTTNMQERLVWERPIKPRKMTSLLGLFVFVIHHSNIFSVRDRIGPFWQNLRDHIYNLAVNATEPTFLVERAVVGLLRLAIRLLRREEIASQVLILYWNARYDGTNVRNSN